MLSELSFIECYGFHMTREDSLFSSFYLQYLPLLEHFCNYFNEKAKDIIDCTDKKKLAAFDQKFDFSRTSQDALLEQKIQEFLQETFIKRRALKTREKEIQLTPRETECLSC